MLTEIILRVLVLIILLLIADLWSLRGLKRTLATHRKGKGSKWLILGSTFLFILFTGFVFYKNRMPGLDPDKLRAYYYVSTFFLLIYGPKLILAIPALAEDIIQLIFRAFISLFSRRSKYNPPLFLNRRKLSILSWPALIISAAMAMFLLYGFFFGRHQIKIQPVDLISDAVPEGFEGVRIAQFSDAHLGSFSDESQVIKGLGMISKAKPDIIVFTGDLVNTHVREALPYLSYFKQLAAPMGKYAVLGNHDMDDYMKWTDEESGVQAINDIADFWSSAGFTLLRNQNVLLEKNNDSLLLAGVDNWGNPPFGQYGDLAKAMEGNNQLPTILLSHNPSHWEAEILETPGIFLTLSGHTHAMQLSFNIAGLLNWSPASLIYPQWDGMYESDGKFIYVNPGFGYIGFLLRSGTAPEISLIQLNRQD